MNQNEQMRELIDAAEEYSKNYEDDSRPDVRCDVMNAFFRGAHWQKKQALAATVKESLTHEPAPLVRLTDEEQTKIVSFFRYCGLGDWQKLWQCSNALQDAWIAKNGGKV